MLSAKEIRQAEMTHGQVMPVPHALIDDGLEFLDMLRQNPANIAFKTDRSRPQEGPVYSLVFRDERFREGELHNPLIDDYTKGLGSLMAFVMKGHPNFPDNPQFTYTLEDGSLSLSAPPFGKANQWRGNYTPAAIRQLTAQHEPAHILAKHLADNGVNFPGSEKFSERGRA